MTRQMTMRFHHPHIRHSLAAVLFATLFLFLGCGGTDSGNDGSAGPTGNAAQKGPFIESTPVTIFQLGDFGERTGEQLQTEVDAEGRWELDGISWHSGPVEVVVEGNYFDENAGTFTDEPRRLRAVTLLSDDSLEVNVNIYTHIVADRLLDYLAENEDEDEDDRLDWSEIREEVRLEFADVVGIEGFAEELDILDARDEVAGDNANLLTFSAALEAAGLNQTQLDEMAEDFGGDGDLDDEGEDHFETIQATALQEGAEMFDRARQNLIDQYGATPPNYSGGTGLAWYGDGCVIQTLFDRRLLCEDASVELQINEGEQDYLRVNVDESASYAIAMQTDNFSRSRHWTVYTTRNNDGTFEGEIGEAASDGTIAEDYITQRLAADEDYWIVLTNDSDATLFDIYFYRVSDGTELDPIVLQSGTTRWGVAGTHIGSSGNNDAYYRLDASGAHVISVGRYVCGGSVGGSTGGRGVELALFEREPNDVADPFEGAPDAESAESGACSQSIEYNLASDKTYFVRVRNQNFTTAFRPAPIGEDFEIRVQRPE